MCQSCPDFINRNPDDPDYFVPRKLEANFRLPDGGIETPAIGTTMPLSEVSLSGWAAGFSEVVQVELLREGCASDAGDSVDSDGLVHLGDIAHGLSRPDLQARYGRWPLAGQSGWSLTDIDRLVPEGQQQVTFFVRARSAEGASVDLGPLVLHLRGENSRTAQRVR
jgi:hypothetical protein